MSLSYDKLQPVLVRDPRMMLDSIRTAAVIKSGSNVSFKQYTTTNISSSSLTFSTPPPSNSVVTDRKVLISIPMRISLTGTCPNGNALLQPGRDAPRAFPIASSTETLTVVLNNQSVSINLSDIINPMMRFNTDNKDKSGTWSSTPTYQDQSQQYGDMYMTSRSPLGSYGDTPDIDGMCSRGAFSFKIITNPVSIGAPVTAIIDVLFTEVIYLSPFHFDTGSACGFYNLSTLDWQFNFSANMFARVWSHDDRSGTAPITSGTVAFGGSLGGPASSSFPLGSSNQPTLLMQFITPCENQMIPQHPITYPYSNTTRYITDVSNVASGLTNTYMSNNIQLNQVPARMYIFMGEQKNDLFSNPSHTDTYFQMNNISIQFLNQPGIFSGANMVQLYDISKKNGCNMSFEQWSGGPVFRTNSFTPVGSVGSVFCFEPSDMGLPSSLAPSVLNQCQMQIQVTTTNISDHAINAALYVIVVNQGSFTILGPGAATLNLGILTQDDVLDANQQPGVNYREIFNSSGGNFFSSIKEFGSRLMPYLEKIHDFVKENKIISSTLASIPHRYAQVGSMGARALGYGEGGQEMDIVQGGFQGGRQLSRNELRNRMKQY